MADKSRKPTKPHPSYPLTAHQNGQRCKKIRGKVPFFGVSAEPEAALERYLALATDLHAGRQPHLSTVLGRGASVKDVCNVFLSRQRHKREAAEIGPPWFED